MADEDEEIEDDLDGNEQPASTKRGRRAAYDQIIEHVFFEHYKTGVSEFVVSRREIVQAKEQHAPDLDLNPGDVPYSYRYRRPLPERILATQPAGLGWIIEGAGRSLYRFKLAKATRIVPNQALKTITLPDATPEIIRVYKLNDEQALLAIVRYNRLIDTFLGLTTYSLQNHLRTAVTGVGQIEIDELYVGIDKHGCHYAIPVQAKGGSDQIGVVQAAQDLAYAAQKFPDMRCRPVAAQFISERIVALFELTIEAGDVKIVEERHYELVPADDFDLNATKAYRS